MHIASSAWLAGVAADEHLMDYWSSSFEIANRARTSILLSIGILCRRSHFLYRTPVVTSHTDPQHATDDTMTRYARARLARQLARQSKPDPSRDVPRSRALYCSPVFIKVIIQEHQNHKGFSAAKYNPFYGSLVPVVITPAFLPQGEAAESADRNMHAPHVVLGGPLCLCSGLRPHPGCGVRLFQTGTREHSPSAK